MCLYIYPENSKEDIKFNKEGYIVAYKVLSLRYGTSSSNPDRITYEPKGRNRYPGLISPMYDLVWQQGHNHSGRKILYLTPNEKTKRIVNRGIHVFLRYEDALRYVDYSDNEVIVKVRCYKQDLVAHGFDSTTRYSAVFREVFLSKEEWLKARKMRKYERNMS